MVSLETWILLFNDQFQVIDDVFPVTTSDQDNISALAVGVKKYRQQELTNVQPAKLTVRRLSDKAPDIDFYDHERTQQQVSELFSTMQVKRLRQNQKIGNLNIPKGDIVIIVKAPAVAVGTAIGGPVTAMVDNKYRHIVLRATTQGIFLKEDILWNGIEDVMKSHFPEFLELFERKLGQKRRLLDDQMRGTAETLIGATTLESYFQPAVDSSELTSEPTIPVVDRIEFNHIAYLSSIDRTKLVKTLVRPDEGNRNLFKEADASWLYFHLIADYLESHPSNITSGRKAKIVVKQCQESWPFPLIVRVGNTDHTYEPKNDFLILKFGLPRLAVAVNSNPPDRPAEDHHRLLIQGASMVRFANTFLDAYKKERNFVFVAIFISDTGVADRYFMYQEKDSNKVYRKKRAFEFVLKEHRVQFALELYNLSSALLGETGDEDTKANVDDLAVNFKNKELPRFTRRTKRFARSDGEIQPGPGARRSSNDNAQVDQLKACGYKVVPDVFEDDGGTWTLVHKLPPHIRTVYRRRDPNKTEYIAKHLRKRSKELTILEYLHTRHMRSPHIIQLIEAIPSTTKEWLILPKMYSILDKILLNSRGTSGRVQLGLGLINGLAYLHEHNIAHRDIKPDNLVCGNDFRLQIIDFGVAIKVQDENTEINEYCGTRGWTAPEMGKADGPTPMHSPIKADRWSCGRVLLHYIMSGSKVWQGHKRFLSFTSGLMDSDPQRRPSLLEWHNFASPCSDLANIFEDGGKEVFQPRQDMAEIDGESMKPPNAKKPRLKR